MFKTQLKSELSSSTVGTARPPPVNPEPDALALLEQFKGYGQFRLTLPDEVVLSERAALIHGVPGVRTRTLQESIFSYLPEDRKLVVDILAKAVETRSAFRYVARLATPSGQVKTIECLGDLVPNGGEITGAFGVLRDISLEVDREALAISRARLLRHMVEDIPVPVVVLDRALRVVGCTSEWARSYGLDGQSAALGKPLGKLVEASAATTSAIIEALSGRMGRLTLDFHAAPDARPVKRDCIVLPWQSGGDQPGGVLMVVGNNEPAFASIEIADKALGRFPLSLLKLLDKI